MHVGEPRPYQKELPAHGRLIMGPHMYLLARQARSQYDDVLMARLGDIHGV